MRDAFLVGALTLTLLVACGSIAVPTDTPVPAADSDALTLVAMGEEAIGLARKTVPDAVLRQVDLSPDGGAISFRFTDKAATRTIVVYVPSPDVPMHDWRVLDEEFTRFSALPKGMDLRAVRAGPAAVARSATGHWSGCVVRAITLFGEGEALSWIVFCNLPEGVVSGWVDVRTGAFMPSSAPPAIPPPTATALESGLTIFFPQQEPVEGERVVMTAVIIGELRLVDGCLRVGSGAGHLLVWPPGFSLSTENDGIEILNGAGQVVARVGEEVRMGGGEVPLIEGAARTRLRIPADCPGRYWIVGRVMEPK